MFDEGVAPFLAFFGHVEEHGGVAGQLLYPGQAVVGGVETSLEHPQCDGRQGKHASTPGHRFCLQVGERDHGVHESPLERLVGVVLPAQEPDFLSALYADSARQQARTVTTVEAAHILLATGSAPINLPFIPFDDQTIVSSTEALTFDKVPDHLLVVGGGYIGLELGSVWKRLGSKVTVVEFLPRIVPLADIEVGTLLARSLAKQGLEFQMETKVTAPWLSTI